MVPPAGFEPAISTLKGWRPWPLDDGDSGKEYSRLFCRRVYRWQTGKPPHRSRILFRFSNISICNIWAGKSALSVTDRDRRRASGRTSQSVTVRRLLTVYLLQIETNYRGGSKPPQRCLSPLWWLGEELHGGVVGGVLVGVVEGFERQQGCGLRIAAALEGVGNEPVGKLGVLGQCRSV